MQNQNELKKLRLTSPKMQNYVSGICLLLTAGIYHAITGLGAGGGKPSSIKVATTTNALLYAIFTTVGFFGGSVLNTVGPKITYVIGCFGYPFYVTGLWYFDAKGQDWYPYLGGAVLGATAGLLWTAANFIQFAYAEEQRKGKYIAHQLFLLAFGSTVGAAIPLGININNIGAGGVPTSVYATFVVIMFVSMLVAGLGVVKPSRVVRHDGTHIAIFKATNFKDEFIGCIQLLKDWRIAALVIPMFSTEICLGLIPTLNAHSCNLRTRSLNNFLFWAIQIPTTLLFGAVLDNNRFSRRIRGVLGLSINVVFCSVGWALAIAIQVKHGLTRAAFAPTWDWTSAAYAEICLLMLIFGIIFIINQMFVMWVLTAMSNDPSISARYGGFYKAMLSAGLCVSFGLEAAQVSYIGQTITQMVLMFIGFPVMLFIIVKGIKPTNYFDEATVIPPKHVREELGIVVDALEVPDKTVSTTEVAPQKDVQ